MRSRPPSCNGFFKTGPGEYGEGDRFRGITVPIARAIAGRHRDLRWGEPDRLIRSPFHEDRLTALLILTLRAPAAPLARRALGGAVKRTG
ncbi:MAG: DNA alkylation repair protein [Kiritimatiellia bacterium]